MKKLLLSGVLAVGLGFPGIARADFLGWAFGDGGMCCLETQMERQQREISDMERKQHDLDQRMWDIEQKAQQDEFMRSLRDRYPDQRYGR